VSGEGGSGLTGHDLRVLAPQPTELLLGILLLDGRQLLQLLLFGSFDTLAPSERLLTLVAHLSILGRNLLGGRLLGIVLLRLGRTAHANGRRLNYQFLSIALAAVAQARGEVDGALGATRRKNRLDLALDNRVDILVVCEHARLGHRVFLGLVVVVASWRGSRLSFSLIGNFLFELVRGHAHSELAWLLACMRLPRSNWPESSMTVVPYSVAISESMSADLRPRTTGVAKLD
jgi:hypothetical protein